MGVRKTMTQRIQNEMVQSYECRKNNSVYSLRESQVKKIPLISRN